MLFIGQFFLIATFISLHIGHYWAVRSFLDSEVTFFWLVGKLTVYVFYCAIGAFIVNVVWMAGKKGMKCVK